MPFGRTASLLLLGVALVAGPLAAEVRLEVLPDGRKVMIGVGSSATGSSGSKRAPRPRAAPSEMEAWIHEYARRLRLDPDLIRAVIQVESGFNPRAKSHKGAMGLMQLMPQTAAQLAVSDPYDPRQNIRGGASYLGAMLQRFGRTDLALAAYNAGPEAVARYGGVPPYAETRDYVEKVLRIHRHDPTFRLEHTEAPHQGKRIYLYRDPNGSLVMTTEPPE